MYPTLTLRLKPTPAIARWTTRAALFALSLTLVALIAHRFGTMPTLTAFNLIIVSILTAALTLLLAVVSSVIIWRQGRTGAGRAAFGFVVAGGLICWPVAFLPTFNSLPRLNDVTTDTASPPKFIELAKERRPGMNAVAYPVRFAALQAANYPDLKPMTIERPVDDAFEIVRDALSRQKLTIVSEKAPEGRTSKSGLIEAVDRTLIFGFYDDVAIRVDGDGTRSRIDLRSASRFGLHDLGRNAERTRRLMREIVARLEATVSTVAGERFQRGRLITKKALEAVQKSRAQRKSQDPSRSGAPREPGSRGQPPAR